jgi:hypothetical protein
MKNEKKIKTVKIKELFDLCGENWFCEMADFDCKEPYVQIYNYIKGNTKIKILIPDPIAHYLRTVSPGSNKMYNKIDKMAKNALREKIKNLINPEE